LLREEGRALRERGKYYRTWGKCSVIQSRKMRSARYVSCTRERRDYERVMVEKSEVKGPIRISRNGWDNHKMDRQELNLETGLDSPGSG
jgi:hypothetical protein